MPSILSYLHKKLPDSIVVEQSLRILTRKLFKPPEDLRLWSRSTGDENMTVLVHNEDLSEQTSHSENVTIFCSNAREQKVSGDQSCILPRYMY